jgi:hypothetical protein
MRKTILVVLVLAASLLSLWSFTTTAQVIDGNACTDACYQQKAACVADCGEHRDPMECDSICREALEDCLRTCD